MRTTFRGLLPSTSSRNLPGPTATKLRQLRPSRRHCPLRRGLAPPSGQVSPVAQPCPALWSGQHPADPAPLPFPRSNWTPHTPLHTMFLQVNRALPQHPDGHTRPLRSVILKPPRSGDLGAGLWPAPAKRKASHLPCSPMLPKRLQFSAQAHAALPLRRRSQPRLSECFAQAQYRDSPSADWEARSVLGSPRAVRTGALQLRGTAFWAHHNLSRKLLPFYTS